MILLKLLFIFFPLGQLARVSLPVGEIGLYYQDVLVGLGGLWKLPQILKLVSRFQLWGVVLTAFFGLGLALDQVSFLQWLVSSLYLLRMIAYGGVGIWLYTQASKKWTFLTGYLYALISASVLFAWLQYIFFPNLEPLFILGWDRHAYRIVGTWLDPNFAGLLFGLFGLWQVDKVLNLKRSRYGLLLSFFAAICFLTLLFTYSRSSLVAVSIGLAMYLWHQSYRWLILAGIGGILLALPLLPRQLGEGTKLERTSTIYARLETWSSDLQQILKRPIFGYGMNTLRYVTPSQTTTQFTHPKQKKDLQHPPEQAPLSTNASSALVSHSASGSDNSLLFLLLTLGTVGGFQIAWVGSRLYEGLRPQTLLLCMGITIGIHGMFVNSWFYPWVWLWILFVVIERKLQLIPKI